MIQLNGKDRKLEFLFIYLNYRENSDLINSK